MNNFNPYTVRPMSKLSILVQAQRDWHNSNEYAKLPLYLKANSRECVRDMIVRPTLIRCVEQSILSMVEDDKFEDEVVAHWPHVAEYAEELMKYELPTIPTERRIQKSNECIELDEKLGKFYMREGSDATREIGIEALHNLQITKTSYVDGQYRIRLRRPGLIIGRKGTNIEALQKYLNVDVRIEEEETDPYYHIIPPLYSEDYE